MSAQRRRRPRRSPYHRPRRSALGARIGGSSNGPLDEAVELWTRLSRVAGKSSENVCTAITCFLRSAACCVAACSLLLLLAIFIPNAGDRLGFVLIRFTDTDPLFVDAAQHAEAVLAILALAIRAILEPGKVGIVLCLEERLVGGVVDGRGLDGNLLGSKLGPALGRAQWLTAWHDGVSF